MIKNLRTIWIKLFFMFSFVKKSKLIIFLYHFIILFNLIFSFLNARSSFIPYASVSIESVDCILLSSLTLNAVLLTSSIKTMFLATKSLL